MCLPLIPSLCSGRLQFLHLFAIWAPEAVLPVSACVIEGESCITERTVYSVFRREVFLVNAWLIMHTATHSLVASATSRFGSDHTWYGIAKPVLDQNYEGSRARRMGICVVVARLVFFRIIRVMAFQ